MRTVVSVLVLGSTAGLALASSSAFPRTLWERSNQRSQKKHRHLADTDDSTGLLSTVQDVTKNPIQNMQAVHSKLFDMADWTVESPAVFAAVLKQLPILKSSPSYQKAAADNTDFSDVTNINKVMPEMIQDFLALSSNLLSTVGGLNGKGNTVQDKVADFFTNADDSTNEAVQGVAAGDQQSLRTLQQQFLNHAFGQGIDISNLINNDYLAAAQETLMKDDNLKGLIFEPTTLDFLSSTGLRIPE